MRVGNLFEILLGGTLVIGVGALASSCFEDEADEFGGIVVCSEGRAPRLTVSLAPGKCEYVPRCEGSVPRWVAEEEYAIDTLARSGLSRRFGDTISPPSLPKESWFLSASPAVPDPDLEIQAGSNPKICLRGDATAEDGTKLYAWTGVRHRDDPEKPDPDAGVADGSGPESLSYVVEFFVTVSRDPGVLPDDAGVGPDADSDAGVTTCDDPDYELVLGVCRLRCGNGDPDPGECDGAGPASLCPEDCPPPEVAINDILVTPASPLGPGFGFSDVTAYLRVEASALGADLTVTCSFGGNDCSDLVRTSEPNPESSTLEVGVPGSLGPGRYEFVIIPMLQDVMNEAEQQTYGLELKANVGRVRCEESTNADFENEERYFGFRLEDESGTPVAAAKYSLYQYTGVTKGWELVDWPTSASGVFSGDVTVISEQTKFVVVADDGMEPTPIVVAAREFNYNDLVTGDARGCEPCSIGAGGTCQVIPDL